MAKNVFISFRFEDGAGYKNMLANKFDRFYDTVDFSEDQDRSWMSEDTIRKYLYSKLRQSSVTIVLLTPHAVNHKHDRYGRYNDWMYDEIRYSLEDRESNRTNGLIAVYTPDAENMLISKHDWGIEVKNVDNLFRVNMMNVKAAYKKEPEQDLYNADYDSYCSLVSWSDFTGNIGRYIDIAIEKRNVKNRYDIVKRL